MAATLGTAAVPTILLIAAGLVFLIIELFTPGFGAPGILGLLLMIAACGVQFLFGSARTALWILAAAMAMFALCLVFVMRSLSKGRLSRSFLVLKDTVSGAAGNDASDSDKLIGQRGVTVTALRPSGIATVNGIRTDVISEGDFAEPGTAVVVVAVKGSRVIVKPAEVQK